MKFGLLKCREEPPKLLQGNKFQERTFQIINHKLLLLKDKKVTLFESDSMILLVEILAYVTFCFAGRKHK